MDSYTEQQGGFIASPGWAALFAAADAAIEAHRAEADHEGRVSIKSKGHIDFNNFCCDALFEALDPIEQASGYICQACGAPATVFHGYLIECETHEGQWPYDVSADQEG